MKKALLIIFFIIIMTLTQGCNSAPEDYENYAYNNVLSDDDISEKLMAHTWERYSKHLSSYIRYTFNEDGTYEYEREYYKDSSNTSRSHGTWSVRDATLYYKSKSIYSSGETKEYYFVNLDPDDVANDILSLGDYEFYVSDEYFVWGGVKYTIYDL